MFGRALSALRILLAGVGIVVLVLLPLSFAIGLTVMLPWPYAYSITTVYGGGVSATTRDDATFPRLPVRAEFLRAGTHPQDISRSLVPRHHRSMLPAQTGGGIAWQTDVSVPLWLLAAVCLAWPVTSFIVARRRRRGRGFEVQAEVSDQKSEVSRSTAGSTPLPPGEVAAQVAAATGADGEGGHQHASG